MAVLLALLLCAAVTASASASAWRPAFNRVPLGGPTIAGGQVAWVERRVDGPGGNLYLARPGHAPRLVQEFPRDTAPNHSSLSYGFELEASSSHLAMLRVRSCVGFNPCAARYDVFAGRRGQRLTRIERCPFAS